MKIVVLASGVGQTLQNVLEQQKDSRHRWRIVGVVTDNPKAGVIERARAAKLPVQVVSQKDFTDTSKWDQALREAIENSGAEMVFLFGFLKKLGRATLGACHGKIFNVHPSLLPRHGGKGMYGRRVHEAVIAAKDKRTGVTIHKVNENYDEGQVLSRSYVEVVTGDTAEALETRVKSAEIKAILEFLATL